MTIIYRLHTKSWLYTIERLFARHGFQKRSDRVACTTITDTLGNSTITLSASSVKCTVLQKPTEYNILTFDKVTE